jgi:hypothetical protein
VPNHDKLATDAFDRIQRRLRSLLIAHSREIVWQVRSDDVVSPRAQALPHSIPRRAVVPETMQEAEDRHRRGISHSCEPFQEPVSSGCRPFVRERSQARRRNDQLQRIQAL